MRTACIALLVATMGLSANAQFFSKEETATKEKEKQAAVKSSLPEADQMRIYIELCDAERRAELKAIQMHPIKIQHTPEIRAEHQKKADQTKVTLLGLYKEEIAKNHSVSVEYLGEIHATGKKKNWPSAKPGTAGE